MAGDYAKRVEDTADIHFQTVKVAVEMMRDAVIPAGKRESKRRRCVHLIFEA